MRGALAVAVMLAACSGSESDSIRDPATGEVVCQVTHSFRSHAIANADDGWQVASGIEEYPCFVFRSPFGRDDRALAWQPRIERDDSIHHFVLYRTRTPQIEGAHHVCRIPRDAEVMLVWSPGGDGAVMPDGVGMELSGGEDEWLILSTHYLNTSGERTDRSGVELCVAQSAPAQTAGVVILGTTAISIPPRTEAHPVQTTCTQRMEFPLNVIASSPHMHERGRAIRSEVVRDEQTVAMLSDVAVFDPERQYSIVHDPPVVIEPGDRVRTTCVYDNDSTDTIRYGTGLADEMCFDYALAYPIDQWPTRYERVCW